VASIVVEPAGQAPTKGLKSGALGLVSSVVIGVASTAPAYSLAATLGFVVVAIGLQAPIVTVLAFIPMYFISVGYQEMNRADPDYGTIFTWATRAFTPRVGWMGGWGLIAADILVMASLAQIAGQYVFELFNAKGIGNNPTSGWVLLVGVLWLVAMTWICYVGIEISANFQKALLGIELTMLTIMSIWALIRVGNGSAPIGHLVPTGSWFNPFAVKHLSDFVVGLADMLFIYWGWDTAVSCNEETADAETVPGKAAVISTFVLLATYALVILSIESFAGIGSTGIGLGNPNNWVTFSPSSVRPSSGIRRSHRYWTICCCLWCSRRRQPRRRPRSCRPRAQPCRWPSTGRSRDRSRGYTSAISRRRSRPWSWERCPSRSTPS